MGACCGKGSKTKDPDKLPYGASPKEEPASVKEPKDYTKSYSIPEIKVNEGKTASEHNDAQYDMGNREASPIFIPVSDPRDSIANDLSPVEDTESAVPPELPEKAVSFGGVETATPPRLSDVIPLQDEGNVQDTSLEEKTSHSEPSSSNTTATEETDVGQVVLHIDESSIKTPEKTTVESPPPPLPDKQGSVAPPLPAKHGGTRRFPEQHAHVMSTSYNSDLPPPLPEKTNRTSPLLLRKETRTEVTTSSSGLRVEESTETTGKAQEAIPDPHTIIENVRHKTKDGGFQGLQTNKPAMDNGTAKVSIQQNKDIPPLKSPISPTKTTDANQNDSMAILGALKMIRNSSTSGPAVEEKEITKTTTEVKTVVTETNKEMEKIVETKVSETSGGQVSTKTTVQKTVIHSSTSGEGSKIPVSPIKKEFSLKEEGNKKSPTVQGGSVGSGSFKLPTRSAGPLVNGSGTKVEVKKVLDGNLAEVEDVLNTVKASVSRTNGSKIDESVDVKDVTEPFQEDTGASLSSLSSDESSDLEGGYVLMENKKASVLELLPDFKPANDDIKYKHTFCPNTRLSTLRNIDKWMNRDEDQPRCMVIKAAPGMGKTSLLKEVCSKYSLQLLADHFFSHCSSNLGHSDLRQVVLSLAHSFTEKLDNYVGCLPTLEEVKQIIYCGSTEDVLDTFIYSALNSEGLGQEEDRKMIMVIDALDDCNFPDREVLFRFINEFTQKAPKWLYLLVSIRDENQLTSLITSVSMLDLCDNAENMADLKKVMKESLSPFMDRISLDGGLTQLAKKCKGLALTASLYNRMLNGMDRKKGIALREIDVKFPTGMNGVLRKTLKDFKSLLDREADASYFYNTLLGMLCYAREPIPVTFAKAIDLRNAEEVWKALNVIVDTHGQREDTKSLHHKSIAEWLLNDKLSEEFQLDGVAARNEIGRLCVKWITPMLDQMPYEDTPVFKYALKHSVSHLTDIPKQQENIGNILCSLKATQMKLEMNGVSILQVVNEYNHTHSRIGDTKKEISLKDYMKKVPKLSEQLNLWYTFLSDNQIGLFHSPKSVYQLAANYVNRPRVQQNARVELAKQPWLEDISTGLADNVDLKVMPGEARLADVSPDGKTVAVVYGSCEDNLQLVQYNSSNLEEISNISIASLEDRKGLCCKFLPDNANVFVGSLVKYVGKKGKIVSTDLDMKSLQLKQKYMVECCAVSSGKYLATSLSTFPFGGRSVHLAIFGFKEKKVVKMLEVLNFRFGGSANFGIRCCAFSPDEKQMAACVKDSNKNQLKVNVWNTVKWNVALTLEVGVDNIRKCHFFESDSLILDVKMVNSTTYNSQVWPCQKSAQPTEVGREKSSSVSSSLQSKAVVISWDNKNKGQIHLWKRGQSHKDATKYRFSGMQITDQVVCCQSTVLCFSKEIMQIFNVSDSEPMEKSLVELDDLNVQDITFMPRSDMGVLSHVKTDAEYDILSIFNCDSVSDEISVKSTKVPQQSMVQNDNVYSNIFQGANKPGKKCYVSHDGKYLVMCCGNRIALWNYQTGKLETMPFPDDMDSDQLIDMCIPSGKESMVAVVYKQQNHKVVLFDLRTKKELRRVGIDGDPVKATVTDMTFMPYTGAFISYHRNMDHRLVVWNQSNGSQRSASSCKINFCRVSSSSDRFILCCRKMESGHLQLRNSDAKFSQKLQTPESWSFQRIDFDLEFSLDGTVLAGVQSQGHMTRIWNAANGDILKDFTLGFIESPSIAGMITNTHMAIYDGRILVIDIASAELLSVTPLPQPGHGKHSISQLSVSSRGNIIAAVYNDGAMTMLKCHNFSPAKMTTTLQRMKSFSGLHG